MNGKLLIALQWVTRVAAEVPEGRVFALDKQMLIQILLQIVNVAVLCVILYKLLYQPVRDALKRRTASLQEEYDEIEAREQEANRLTKEYEGKLEEIQAERADILAEAREDGNQEKARILAEAEEEAEQIKAEATRGLEMERQLLRENAKDYVLELSTLMAEKQMKANVSPEQQARSYEESLRELEAAQWQK